MHDLGEIDTHKEQRCWSSSLRKVFIWNPERVASNTVTLLYYVEYGNIIQFTGIVNMGVKKGVEL